MVSQPYDEHNSFDNIFEYDRVDTSRYSENFNQTLPQIATFSSILTPSLTSSSTPHLQSSTDDDSNDVIKYLNTTPETDQELDNFLKNNMFDSEMTPDDELNQFLCEEINLLELKNLDQSIVDREMSVETQPTANIRRRYQSDGKRQIERSRSKPMTIKLPNLKGHLTNSEQSFWLELVLTTTDQNQAGKVYIHVDRLEYHAQDAETHDGGFVRVPLTPTDIEKGIKELARISIIKAKLDTYTCQLIPLNGSSTDDTVEIYKNVNAKSVVAKAKRLRDAYQLDSSRICCQLLIKQNQTWHRTNINCESIIMDEIEKPTKKRSTPSNASDNDVDNEKSPVRGQKNLKLSSFVGQTLPIVRLNKP